MAGIPLFFPPSARQAVLETTREIPFRPYHNAGRIEKRRPQRPLLGSLGHLSDKEQIIELRRSRKAIKDKLYAKIAHLQRECDALQLDSEDYIDEPVDYEPAFFRATRFWPSNPTAEPKELFAHSLSEFRSCSVVSSRPARMVRFDAPDDEILLYTSASCLNQHETQDTTTRSAACAGIFKPTGLHPSVSRTFCFRLEHRGPKGGFHAQESNRAHLRAAIAALQYRPWGSEGWSRVVIASDSEYLVEGITNWVEIWQSNGWVTADQAGYGREGDPVANRDLWELLIWEIEERARRGIEIKFWLILHAQNTEAHAEARAGAEALKAEDYFTSLRGLELDEGIN